MKISTKVEGYIDSIFVVWADFIKSCGFGWTKKPSCFASQSYDAHGMLRKRIDKSDGVLISWQ